MTSLIERMEKRGAPMAWGMEVLAMLNKIRNLEEDKEVNLEIIHKLATEREVVTKVLGNVADSIDARAENGISPGERDALRSIVRHIDNFLVELENAQ